MTFHRFPAGPAKPCDTEPSTIERAMERTRTKQRHRMTAFDFVYPLCVGDVQIAEIEGCCTVIYCVGFHFSRYPDELEIEFYECGSHRTVPAEGTLRAQVGAWLWRTKADEIWAGAPRERDPGRYPVGIEGKV